MLATPPNPFTEQDGSAYIQEARTNQYEQNVSWAIKFEGQFCGGIKAKTLHETATIGYWLRRDHWGKGLMSEAVKAVLEYLFPARKQDIVVSDVFKPL